MKTMVQNDINAVRRLVEGCALDVRPDLFSECCMDHCTFSDWRANVSPSIRRSWWELDDRTRRLIAMVANGDTS